MIGRSPRGHRFAVFGGKVQHQPTSALPNCPDKASDNNRDREEREGEERIPRSSPPRGRAAELGGSPRQHRPRNKRPVTPSPRACAADRPELAEMLAVEADDAGAQAMGIKIVVEDEADDARRLPRPLEAEKNAPLPRVSPRPRSRNRSIRRPQSSQASSLPPLRCSAPRRHSARNCRPGRIERSSPANAKPVMT
jgi:hypothetical protein